MVGLRKSKVLQNCNFYTVAGSCLTSPTLCQKVISMKNQLGFHRVCVIQSAKLVGGRGFRTHVFKRCETGSFLKKTWRFG